LGVDQGPIKNAAEQPRGSTLSRKKGRASKKLSNATPSWRITLVGGSVESRIEVKMKEGAISLEGQTKKKIQRNLWALWGRGRNQKEIRGWRWKVHQQESRVTSSEGKLYVWVSRKVGKS